MLRVFKQIFIAILSFSRSLATKCVSLNYKPCMTKPSLVNLNHLLIN